MDHPWTSAIPPPPPPPSEYPSGGTMQLDHLLETYHDQLRLENASKLDIMIINCLKARDQIILTVFISEHFNYA